MSFNCHIYRILWRRSLSKEWMYVTLSKRYLANSWANLRYNPRPLIGQLSQSSSLIGQYPRQPTWAPGSRDLDQSHNSVSGSQSEIYLRALKFNLLWLKLGTHGQYNISSPCWLSADLLLHSHWRVTEPGKILDTLCLMLTLWKHLTSRWSSPWGSLDAC